MTRAMFALAALVSALIPAAGATLHAAEVSGTPTSVTFTDPAWRYVDSHSC